MTDDGGVAWVGDKKKAEAYRGILRAAAAAGFLAVVLIEPAVAFASPMVGGGQRRVLLFLAFVNQGLLGCFLVELWEMHPLAFIAQFGVIVLAWCVALFLCVRLTDAPGIERGDLLRHQRWLFRGILGLSILDMELLPLLPWACSTKVLDAHDGFPTWLAARASLILALGRDGLGLLLALFSLATEFSPLSVLVVLVQIADLVKVLWARGLVCAYQHAARKERRRASAAAAKDELDDGIELHENPLSRFRSRRGTEEKSEWATANAEDGSTYWYPERPRRSPSELAPAYPRAAPSPRLRTYPRVPPAAPFAAPSPPRPRPKAPPRAAAPVPP